MSSIKLSPNASGTGIFSIEAPNSSTNRTLTLPDQTGTVLTNAGPFTANASASNGAVTIDASNNVGIGTSSPSYRLDLAGADGFTGIRCYDGTNTAIMQWHTADGFRFVTTGAKPFIFSTNNAERARIDSSGNLLVGTTTTDIWTGSATNTGFKVESNGTTTLARSGFAALLVKRTTASTGDLASFAYGTSVVGTISTNGTGTTYGTSSDYRLKHDIQPMTGALAKVAALKPVTYKWNVDNSAGEGFIAHELQAVVPDAVTGEKDAVDAEGKPVYQGIDTSFLVATLTAAIQELKAEVDALKAQLGAQA